MTEPSWFADHGVTFVYPADWEEVDFDDVAPPETVFQFMVTSERGSGNWIAFQHYPLSVAADYGATDETFDLDSHIRTRALVHGPTEITIAGLSGRELGVFGNIRNQTGGTYEGEVVWLCGEDATYLLMAQYVPGSEDIVLSAWQTMLTNFEIEGISSDADSGQGKADFGDGTWIVGVDIEPGTYRNDDSSDLCFWHRLSGFGGHDIDTIASGLSLSIEIVEIAESDAGFDAEDCGTWSTDLSPRTDSPEADFGDGIWLVTSEISPGSWRNDGSSDFCFWQRLSGFGGESEDEIARGVTEATPVVVKIAESDVGFSSQECGAWTKVG